MESISSLLSYSSNEWCIGQIGTKNISVSLYYMKLPSVVI